MTNVFLLVILPDADLVLENMVNAGQLQLDLRDRVKEALLRRHRHQHEKRHDRGEKNRLPTIRSLVDIGRNSSKSMFGSHSKSNKKKCLSLSLFLSLRLYLSIVLPFFLFGSQSREKADKRAKSKQLRGASFYKRSSEERTRKKEPNCLLSKRNRAA